MADVSISDDSILITAINMTERGTPPDSPASGHFLLYVLDGVVYLRGHTGDPIPVGGSVGLTENLLAVGDSSGQIAALAAGGEGAVPTRQADGTIAETVPEAPESPDLTLIATHTVPGGGEASYTFSGIPDTYADLLLTFLARTDRAGQTLDALALRFNGDSANNYSSKVYYAYNVNSTGGTAYASTSYGGVLQVPGASSDTNEAASGRLWIPKYLASAFYHGFSASGQFQIDGQAINTYLTWGGGSWRSKSAITSLTVLSANGANLYAGCVFALYGAG
jgi:hypothetical protein